MRSARLIAVALALFWSATAFAQTSFITPAPNKDAQGMVVMCQTKNGAFIPCGAPGALPLPVVILNPTNAPVAEVVEQPQVVTAIATGSTGAVTATFALVPNKTLYICGFDVSALGGTAAIGPITVTGLLGGTFTYQFTSTAAGVTLNRLYTPCVPAANQTTAIAIVTTADGTASAVDVNAWGVVQ